MLIDWVTVLAQIVNFLLLVFFLNRFLFQPIFRMVDKRDSVIRKTLEDASTEKNEAKNEKEKFIKENEVLQQKKDELLAIGRTQAKEEEERLIHAARDEYENLRSAFQNSLQTEKEAVFSKKKTVIEETVFSLIQKVLQDLANKNLEEQVIEVFLQKVRETSGEEMKPFFLEVQNQSAPVLIKSGFELSPPGRDTLEKEIREVFGEKINLSFEKDTKLICGIKLVTTGHKIEWTLSHYFELFRNSI